MVCLCYNVGHKNTFGFCFLLSTVLLCNPIYKFVSGRKMIMGFEKIVFKTAKMSIHTYAFRLTFFRV